jgi:hypothetical protein
MPSGGVHREKLFILTGIMAIGWVPYRSMERCLNFESGHIDKLGGNNYDFLSNETDSIWLATPSMIFEKLSIE